MSRTCDYCKGLISGKGYQGRPWPNTPPANYCCFGCLSLGEADLASLKQPSNHSWKLDGFSIRLGVSLFIIGQSMIFGLGINLHDDTPRTVKLIVHGIILAATLVVVALLGWPLFRNTLSELSRKRITVELLFILTLVGAMAASLQSFISGSGPIYFEVVSVLLVVYSLGKAIGARSRAAALASSRQWAKELATSRLVDSNGRTRNIPVSEVQIGDRVEVHPGESFSVDGVIREGTGFVSEAAVRGEPFAVVRRQGDQILAGTISYDALFRVEATKPGKERQIDRLLNAVEEAKSKPLSVQSIADRLTAIFLPILLILAGGTFAYWTSVAGWQTGTFRSMSVLLVACPCALGLATPIVLWSALGRLAERGIVVQSGDVIERLATADSVLFDKTGTLTEDRYALTDLVTTEKGDKRQELLSWLGAVQQKSDHPVARPFAELTTGSDVHVLSFQTFAGRGVRAIIRDASGEQHEVKIGRPEWLDEKGEILFQLESQLLHREGHKIAFSLDGAVAGLAVLTERLRDSASDTLESLQRMQIPFEVLTGDRTERAEVLGLQHSLGNLLPEEKQSHIQRLIDKGRHPIMIGDGVNDAAALKTAHVSFAMASGTDIALGSSDAVMYTTDLRVIPWAMALSREAMRVVRRNIFRATAYNILGVSLAACGMLHPITAALLMVFSSLLVAWSSVRIGVPANFDHCFAPPIPVAKARFDLGLTLKMFLHMAAFFGQAWMAVRMLELTGTAANLVILGFTICGGILSLLWSNQKEIGHDLDMSFGMISLGNFGMLLGWWADNSFQPFQNLGTCECVEAMHRGVFKPWMWLLMLLFSNLAMLFAARRPHPNLRYHRFAMFTGGNVGMVLGMFAGGWLASRIVTDQIQTGALLSFTGMTLGMIIGMWLLTRITQESILWMLSLRRIPGWLRTADSASAEFLDTTGLPK